MADGILRGAGELCGSALLTRRDEHRVVAEATATAGHAGDAPLPGAVCDEGGLVGGGAQKHDDALVARLAKLIGHLEELGEQLVKIGLIPMSPLHGQVAAVSVGIVGGIPVLDLDYAEDSQAETDMNVVMNNGGAFIEVQGTAEGHAFRRHELDALLNLAASGIAELFALQSEALLSP